MGCGLGKREAVLKLKCFENLAALCFPFLAPPPGDVRSVTDESTLVVNYSIILLRRDYAQAAARRASGREASRTSALRAILPTLPFSSAITAVADGKTPPVTCRTGSGHMLLQEKKMD